MPPTTHTQPHRYTAAAARSLAVDLSSREPVATRPAQHRCDDELLAGVGYKTNQLLQAMAVQTVAEMRAQPRHELERVFGGTQGLMLHMLSMCGFRPTHDTHACACPALCRENGVVRNV